MWEDNQTGAQYSQKNASSLWGNNNVASTDNDGFSGPSNESFVPLNEEDLKAQFADGAVPQPSKELGEHGMPSIDEFGMPTGELANVLKPVFFNTDDHILRGKEYLETINKIAMYLKTHSNATIVIEGHCDERAGEAYNLALGSRRANYVRSLLVKQGVNPDQLHTISYGKEHPFAQGHNPDSWSQNRRAHFRVHQK
jgi:peptidoglycan-associated lipoprotein